MVRDHHTFQAIPAKNPQCLEYIEVPLINENQDIPQNSASNITAGNLRYSIYQKIASYTSPSLIDGILPIPGSTSVHG